jgi:hypothetical protein
MGKSHFVDTFSTELSMTKSSFPERPYFKYRSSLLQGDIKFNLHDDGSWADFADKVKWDMNIKQGSQLSGYDISYFVTNWDNLSLSIFQGK